MTFAGAVLVIVVLYWAQAVFVPIALAVLLSFVLSPPVSWLERWLGRVPAVLMVVTLVFVVLGLAGWGLARQMDNLAEDLPRYRVNILAKIADVRGAGKGGTVEKLQETIDEIKTDLGKTDAPTGRAPQPVIVAPGSASGIPGFYVARSADGPVGNGGPRGGARDLHAARTPRLARSADRAGWARPPDRHDQGVRRSGQPRQPPAVDAITRQRGVWHHRRARAVLSRRAVPTGVGRARRGTSLHPIPRSRARRRRAHHRQPRRSPRMGRFVVGDRAVRRPRVVHEHGARDRVCMPAPPASRKWRCSSRWPSGPGCGDRLAC